MKLLILAAVCGLISTAAFAQESDGDVQCGEQAQEFLAEKLKVDVSEVTFFNGAMVGDGANTIEIDMFKVEKQPGLYKVELDADGCSFRNHESINN